MSVSDLSKTFYDFRYNSIKPKYDTKAKFLFTYTDTLMYEPETENFYKDITPDVKSRFDTSNYPKYHTLEIQEGTKLSER
mgnify:CR=1 FL=1